MSSHTDQASIAMAERERQEEENRARYAKTNEEAFQLALNKWLTFNKVMRNHTNALLQKQISRQEAWGAIFRTLIIILSALVTVIADVQIVERFTVTIVAGTLTALTGIEAYFQFNQRRLEAQRRQREVEALRYKLRFQWLTTVQMETDETRRLEAAKKFLWEGQEAYNAILNKYVLKPDEDKQS